VTRARHCCKCCRHTRFDSKHSRLRSAPMLPVDTTEYIIRHLRRSDCQLPPKAYSNSLSWLQIQAHRQLPQTFLHVPNSRVMLSLCPLHHHGRWTPTQWPAGAFPPLQAPDVVPERRAARGSPCSCHPPTCDALTGHA